MFFHVFITVLLQYYYITTTVLLHYYYSTTTVFPLKVPISKNMWRQTVKRALVIHVRDERQDVLFRYPGVLFQLEKCSGILSAHMLERVDNVRFDLFLWSG